MQAQSRFPKTINHVAINRRTQLEITCVAKMTSMPNHALEKLKRSLVLANPTFLKGHTQEWSQDLQKPKKNLKNPYI